MEDKLIQEMRNNKEINKCCYCEYTSYRGCNIKNGNLYNPNNNCVYFVPNENKIADYKIEKLEQQLKYKIAENKQMREALQKIINGTYTEYNIETGKKVGTFRLCISQIEAIAQEALNKTSKKQKLEELTRLSQEYKLYDNIKEGE